MAEANLVFYGVRGSYPVPDRNTIKYGGNTSSILIERNGAVVILDAGTGIIRLGMDLNQRKRRIKTAALFLTHLHVDHIHGLPFFEPVFDKEFELSIYAEDYKNVSYEKTIYSLFNQPLSPIGNKGIKAAFKFFPLNPEKPAAVQIAEGFSVEYIREDLHPTLIYKVNVNGKRIVYATDVESPEGFNNKHLEFIRGADILIHDSQYFDGDYHSGENSKKGFGHSTVSMAVANAVRCGAKKLYLFHHNPCYSDEELERMLREARKGFKETYLAEELKKISLRR
jgi:ribonuclease BN (tRNA processing enzyme)